MRVANYDRVEPPLPSALPLRLVATCSWRSAGLLAVVAVPAGVGAGAATLALLAQALSAPAARAILAQHPALGLEIAAALAFWLYVLALPIRRLLGRLSTRTVAICEGTVSVTERGGWRTRRWSQPLAAYLGVAHHVRASLSGTRHELILVHPDKSKSVLLALAARLPAGEAERAALLLGRPVVPSSALYRLPAPLSRLGLPTWRSAAPTSPLAAATWS